MLDGVVASVAGESVGAGSQPSSRCGRGAGQQLNPDCRCRSRCAAFTHRRPRDAGCHHSQRSCGRLQPRGQAAFPQVFGVNVSQDDKTTAMAAMRQVLAFAPKGS